MKLYIDDPNGDGPDPNTSHPLFAKYFQETFYYDCTDEYSPFGNDVGADILAMLEMKYQNNDNTNIISWILSLIDEFGFECKPDSLTRDLNANEISNLERDCPGFILTVDRAFIACAFGQIKISGTLSKELFNITNLALKRELSIFGVNDSDYHKNLTCMISDINKFNHSLG